MGHPFEYYERRRIATLLPGLGIRCKELAEKSCDKMPVRIYFNRILSEYGGSVSWIDHKGISRFTWDVYNITEPFRLLEENITPEDYVKRFVPKLEDASRIASDLKISFG